MPREDNSNPFSIVGMRAQTHSSSRHILLKGGASRPQMGSTALAVSTAERSLLPREIRATSEEEHGQQPTGQCSHGHRPWTKADVPWESTANDKEVSGPPQTCIPTPVRNAAAPNPSRETAVS